MRLTAMWISVSAANLMIDATGRDGRGTAWGP
ncbi:hypothetical protein GA0070610_0986 [Micromonospora echinofusca]|uniref:Uncharacterized protein n=1 Tax=Micromonospora echinofusca TaxID=47858 RepID=A0A1C5G4X2_MICEH|nr:hypothetical protein GA0070610_0986 [Micromonospora echinofusca]